MNTPTEKYCPKCERIRPRAEWCAAKHRRDGLQSTCRDCMNIKARQTRARYKARPPEDVTIPATKRCPYCEVVKRADEFNRNYSVHDGLQSYCRVCSVIANAVRRKLKGER